MQKLSNLALFFVMFFAVAIIVGCTIFNMGISSVSKNEELKQIEITPGSSYLNVSKLLKDNNLIKSEFYYKLYIKLSDFKTLEACKYQLSENMGVKKIVEELGKGCKINPDVINITFKEGWNMRKIAETIDSNTNNKVDDIYSLLKNSKYIDEIINKYWFLTENIKNKNIYYPLEGYLFPNTYQYVNKDVSVKEIFKSMLDEMNNKLTLYKNDIDNKKYNIHELLTLASIIELEGASSDDRKAVAGVFYNRLEDKWTLGSDVTTYYAEKIDDWSKGLTISQINSCNAYNTRGTCFVGLPVGPICNPGLESIVATFEPEDNDYYYFVADCSGKTYLNYTEVAHNTIRRKLINEGKWCDN